MRTAVKRDSGKESSEGEAGEIACMVTDMTVEGTETRVRTFSSTGAVMTE